MNHSRILTDRPKPEGDDMQALMERIQNMDYPQHLDCDFDGSCPCFHADLGIDGRTLSIDGYCWRVSGDGLQDLFVCGDLFTRKELKLVGNALKKKLDGQEWYSKYRLHYGTPKGL